MELLVAGQLFYFDSYCTGASWVMEFLTNYNQGKLKTLSPFEQPISFAISFFFSLSRAAAHWKTRPHQQTSKQLLLSKFIHQG